MAQGIWRRIAQEHPVYVELGGLLELAAKTWPAYGISAAELSRLDPVELEYLRLIVGG